MKAANLNHLWASLIIEELSRCGVQYFLIAPGSRSTPLAVAAARNRKVSTLVHYDERGAAYAALGSGKTGYPAAVICSSGTAVANCFPAVAEASLSATPLIILSADRPPELQDCGANQTMPQQGIFGEYTRFHKTLPCPDTSISAIDLLENIDMIVAAAGLPGSGGAAHLNCMFREPLAPTSVPWPSSYLDDLDTWKNAESPLNEIKQPVLSLSESQLEYIANKVQHAQRGLLLIGRLSSQKEFEAARHLAASIPWPVFADIGSNCRCDSRNTTNIHTYDTLLHAESFRRYCIPDIILHIGDVFVSKRLQEHLASLCPEYIHLHPREDNRDPTHRVTQHYRVDISAACNQLLNQKRFTFCRSKLLLRLQELNVSISTCLHTYLDNENILSELTVASIIKKVCTQNNSLFIGNSMPIRDMDTVVDTCKVRCIGINRGVSGIDGNIATAVGMGWASNKLALALIGDTAALHDLNSLALLHKVATPVILIVVNNGGGGIFSFLPIAEHKELLDTYFTNSHALHFDNAASLYNLPYYSATTAYELKSQLETAINAEKSAVIEVLINHEANIKAHQSLANLCIQETEAFFSE